MPTDRTTIPRLVSRIRIQLFTELGWECAECGETSCLQIDHPFGRDWTPRRTNIYNRWLRYRREHEQGLVRLLCRDCNEHIRPRPLPAHGADLAQPF